ncbi:hypothetical protein GCM10008023_06930 [Sphingomonas glacialis]|uniref:Uncharacterized protein n=1 Tax=Sphingomonas glacialis TaxID=658225 RepID=A0ABQ3LAE5_9SPHN|nr:hypothetical protein GCM10008023_06930 [Sphingomonas glacialis]
MRFGWIEAQDCAFICNVLVSANRKHFSTGGDSPDHVLFVAMLGKASAVVRDRHQLDPGQEAGTVEPGTIR